MVRKREIYARHGVGEYWIADPDTRSIRVLVLEGWQHIGWPGSMEPRDVNWTSPSFERT